MIDKYMLEMKKDYFYEKGYGKCSHKNGNDYEKDVEQVFSKQGSEKLNREDCQ